MLLKPKICLFAFAKIEVINMKPDSQTHGLNSPRQVPMLKDTSRNMFTNGHILFTVYLTTHVVFCQISYRCFQNIGYFPNIGYIVVNLSHSQAYCMYNKIKLTLMHT